MSISAKIKALLAIREKKQIDLAQFVSNNWASFDGKFDGLMNVNFNFLNLDLTAMPWNMVKNFEVHWECIGVILIPIISGLLSYLLSRVTSTSNGQEMQPGMKSMMITMPLMSVWIAFVMPASLGVYWIANSLLMMVQEVICGKILRKDYEAAQREMEAQAKKAREEEKERRRIAAERKAAAIAAGTYKKGKQQGQKKEKEKGVDLSASREGIRAYARGRAYDPNRYPTTPYRDPDDKYKKKAPAEPEELTEEEKEILRENGVPIPQQGQAVEKDSQTPGEEPVQQDGETKSNS